MAYVEIAIAASFIVLFLGIVVYTVVTTKPLPRKPRGPIAIQMAIDRWDRRARWGIWGGPLSYIPVAQVRAGLNRHISRARRGNRRHHRGQQ